MRHVLTATLGLAALVTMTTPAEARDLQGRMGLGYNAQFASSTAVAFGVPAVSVKYAFTRDIATELVAGFATTKPGSSVFGGKFFKNIFFETNLNFYYMLGAGLVSGNNNSGAQFLTGFGSEFFIPGVESLGFSMELGASLDNLSGSYALKTMGFSFINAGMHFYF